MLFVLANGVITPGQTVGNNFPDFKAKDQNGKTWTLLQALGQSGAVLVVCRPADAWRSCGPQLLDFEEARASFEQKGFKVLGLTSANAAALRASNHFPLITVPDKHISAGVYILDAKGVVKDKFFDADERVYFTAGNVLTRTTGFVPDQSKYAAEGKQLKATPTSSNPLVLAGQRIALVLDLELKPNMHVYAAGAQGYLPIAWTMKDNDIAKAHEALYPKPEPFLMTAVSESVPAYKNRIRLIRDVTINPAADFKTLNAAGEFVIEGVLKYQACDDRMCYFPQEMPLLWTLKKAAGSAAARP